jgi:Cu2+-exporting ATPase
MNPTVRSPLPLAPGLTRRTIERKALLAKRMDVRVKPPHAAPPDRTARERAHANAGIRRNAADMTTVQRGFFHGLSAPITLAAAAGADRPFFNSAARALAARLNMDVPISVGVVLALGMSVFETLQQSTHVYFDVALMLLTLLLVGRTLEQAMRRHTAAAAGNFAAPRAETLTKFVSDTELAEVPAASVEPGDLVLVRPGERIAVDGVIIEGRSEIYQSLVTGETLPVSAAKDSMVYAGTLNVSGALRVRVITAPPPYPPPHAIGESQISRTILRY